MQLKNATGSGSGVGVGAGVGVGVGVGLGVGLGVGVGVGVGLAVGVAVGAGSVGGSRSDAGSDAAWPWAGPSPPVRTWAQGSPSARASGRRWRSAEVGSLSRSGRRRRGVGAGRGRRRGFERRARADLDRGDEGRPRRRSRLEHAASLARPDRRDPHDEEREHDQCGSAVTPQSAAGRAAGRHGGEWPGLARALAGRVGRGHRARDDDPRRGRGDRGSWHADPVRDRVFVKLERARHRLTGVVESGRSPEQPTDGVHRDRGVDDAPDRPQWAPPIGTAPSRAPREDHDAGDERDRGGHAG